MALSRAFDDVHTKRMGEAFDAVCARLHGLNYPVAVREAIADCVIQTMSVKPECDSTSLAAAVLQTLGIKP